MDTETRSAIRKTAGWSIVLGVVMIILGVLAILAPLITAIAVNVLLGWLFIIGGVFQAIYAFQHNHRRSSLILKLLLSLVAIAAGVFLVAYPLAGVISLTLLIGIYFFIDGIVRVFLAFQLRPHTRWIWVLLNGILMIILGILIWSQWPFSATWVLGLLVGIGLLSSGIAVLMFAIAAQPEFPPAANSG